MTVPKTFVFNVHAHELRETAGSVLSYMEQLRNHAITEASCYDTYKNRRRVKTKEYRHNAYRLACILSEVASDELIAVGRVLDEFPRLARYDPLNDRAFSTIAPKPTGKLKRRLRGMLNELGIEKNNGTGYHVLQAALYLGKKSAKPLQPGLKPQEITESEKKLLVRKLFAGRARLINNETDEAIKEISEWEDATYNPGWRLVWYNTTDYVDFNYDEDLCDTQFVLSRDDFEDMIKYQERDSDGNYNDPDDAGICNAKDLFLIKLKKLGYFMTSYDDDFHGNVLYMDSFAPDAQALLRKLNAGPITDKRIRAVTKRFEAKTMDNFCSLASALGYLAAATHWLPAGSAYEALQDIGFRQVGVKRKFRHFVDDESNRGRSDAVILWKNLRAKGAACAD